MLSRVEHEKSYTTSGPEDHNLLGVQNYYENKFMQYTTNFNDYQNDNFHFFFFFIIFHFFAENINCGYMLEPPCSF